MKFPHEALLQATENDSGLFTTAGLCRRYGISRETFYVWQRRRRAGGAPDWFEDRSHAPLHCPHATAEIGDAPRPDTGGMSAAVGAKACPWALVPWLYRKAALDEARQVLDKLLQATLADVLLGAIGENEDVQAVGSGCARGKASSTRSVAGHSAARGCEELDGNSLADEKIGVGLNVGS